MDRGIVMVRDRHGQAQLIPGYWGFVGIRDWSHISTWLLPLVPLTTNDNQWTGTNNDIIIDRHGVLPARPNLPGAILRLECATVGEWLWVTDHGQV